MKNLANLGSQRHSDLNVLLTDGRGHFLFDTSVIQIQRPQELFYLT